MVDDDKVKFDSKITKIGGSHYLRIPPNVLNYLDLENGSLLKMQVEKGDFGRYASFWSPDQQDQE